MLFSRRLQNAVSSPELGPGRRAHSSGPLKKVGAIAVCSLLLAAVLFALDGAGCFILLGYVPLYIGVVLYGVLAARWALRLSVGTRWRREYVITFVLLLSLILFALPWLETSNRKRFYLASTSLSAGMAMADARRIMSSYYLFDKFEEEGVLTFSHKTSADSEDRVIVSFSPETGVIERVEYSAD